MKYFLFFVFVFSVSALACDVCNLVEYPNRGNVHYIGFLFRFRGFNGYQHLSQKHSINHTFRSARVEHEPTAMFIDKSQKDWERYYTYELRINYNFDKKWNFLVLIPYQQNLIYYHNVYVPAQPVRDTLIRVNGWGDALGGIEKIFNLKSQTSNFLLKPGLALKFPTGNYKKKIGNTLVDPVIQTGSSSYDGIIRFSGIVSDDKKGVELITNYRINFTGLNGYKFGNRINFQSNVYYTIFTDVYARIVPKAGYYGELSYKDRFKGILIDYTGGHTSFIHVGLDILIYKIQLSFSFEKPIYENLNGPVIGNAGRFIGSAFLNF
jgi:hypothetical protein